MPRNWVPAAFYIAGGILIIVGVVLVLLGVAYRVKYLCGG